MTALYAPSIKLIVATDLSRGIGKANQLPWHLPEDLAHFKKLTTSHSIIMGRNTYDSIGRPLPNRQNIVITRNNDWYKEGVDVANSLDDALKQAKDTEIFIIGGGQIYQQALPHAQHLYITQIEDNFACDTFFPSIEWHQWQCLSKERHHSEKAQFYYSFLHYQRV